MILEEHKKAHFREFSRIPSGISMFSWLLLEAVEQFKEEVKAIEDSRLVVPSDLSNIKLLACSSHSDQVCIYNNF